MNCTIARTPEPEQTKMIHHEPAKYCRLHGMPDCPECIVPPVPAPPTNPESAGRKLAEQLFQDTETFCYVTREQINQAEDRIGAAADSLIETAIERCARVCDEEAQIYKDMTSKETGDFSSEHNVCDAVADEIRALTPASIREEHARK